MATKWLPFFLFCIQAGYLSCCVFDKVKEVKVGRILYDAEAGDKDGCFAACYAESGCSAVLRSKENNRCNLLEKGETSVACQNEKCYILQRDEVDPVCKTFVNF